MGKVYDWFEERLEVQAIADDISSKYVPPHVNIFYCFGGIVFTCFLVQVATGFAMTFYYRPSVVDAFASVEYIMTSVNFGWLIRSIHRWSASMMVMMLVLHVFRVYLTGGFKKTKRINMGNRGNFSCCYSFFWGNWVLFTMGSSRILGM
jgi:cytochrome b6